MQLMQGVYAVATSTEIGYLAYVCVAGVRTQGVQVVLLPPPITGSRYPVTTTTKRLRPQPRRPFWLPRPWHLPSRSSRSPPMAMPPSRRSTTFRWAALPLDVSWPSRYRRCSLPPTARVPALTQNVSPTRALRPAPSRLSPACWPEAAGLTSGGFTPCGPTFGGRCGRPRDCVACFKSKTTSKRCGRRQHTASRSGMGLSGSVPWL